jgi:hypothetical protein
MRILLVLFVCAGTIVSQADGQEIAVVSPHIGENTEAPESNSPFTEDVHVQEIHSSTVFNALPTGGATLTEISFRPDGAVQIGEQAMFGRIQISLSVTQVNPLGLSNTFADNVTGTPIVVYDSSWSATVVNEDHPPGSATRPFDFRIPLQTPYDYDPADGNLLLDRIFEPLVGITNAGLFDVNDPGTFDNQGTWTGSLGVDSPVSNGGRFAAVTEFVFVPEPSTLLLAMFGIANAYCYRRRR